MRSREDWRSTRKAAPPIVKTPISLLPQMQYVYIGFA